MSKLFDRTASVIVSLVGQTTGIELSGLRIEFDVKKTSDITTNTATVRVYNLSEDTRNQLSTVETPQLILNAGYVQDSGEEVLFIGDVTNIKHERNTPDWISTFECDDGEIALKDNRLSISRVAGSSAKEILTTLISSFKDNGIALKYLDPSIIDQKYANAFAASGTAKEILTKVTDRLGAEWSIQAKQLKIVKDGETDGLVGVKISPTSGLIGRPQRLSFTALKKKKGLKAEAGTARNAKKTGWTVRSLLQPKVEPQSRIVIESEELLNDDSTYRVESVSHIGDTHGDAWISTIEAMSL